jgi:hypothetical protein
MAANPLTWMILGVHALTTAVVAMIVYFDEFADTFARLGPIAQIILSPVMGLIVALKLLWEVGSALVLGLLGDWQPLADFWDGLVGTIMHIPNVIRRSLGLAEKEIAKATPQVIVNRGGGDIPEGPAGAADVAPQMVSPQERVARTIDETRTTSAAELLIRDETGRGVLKQPATNPTLIELVQSGAF